MLMLGVMKKCGWCSQTKPEKEFPLRQFPSGARRTSHCIPCVPKVKANRKKWVNSEKGKAWKDRTMEMPGVIQSKKKHRASDWCKAQNAKYNASDAGCAAAERKRLKAKEPDHALFMRLGSKMSRMASGETSFSLNVQKHSGFQNADELRTHLQSTASFDIAIEPFHIDHIIAKVWYYLAFADGKLSKVSVSEENLKRCWSPTNLQAIRPNENMSKAHKLPSLSVLMSVQSIWPEHWQGKLPCDAYVRLVGRYMCRGLGVE